MRHEFKAFARDAKLIPGNVAGYVVHAECACGWRSNPFEMKRTEVRGDRQDLIFKALQDEYEGHLPKDVVRG